MEILAQSYQHGEAWRYLHRVTSMKILAKSEVHRAKCKERSASSQVLRAKCIELGA